MVVLGGRSVAKLPQLRLQCLASCPSGLSSSHVQRVASLYSSFQFQNILDLGLSHNSLRSHSCRGYATKPVSRPKAHTGRTTSAARKAPTTSKTKAAKKPATKTKTPKAKPTATSKAKPRIKAKPKRAKKAKAKPKPKKKKVLTEAQKKAAAIKELKIAALKSPDGTPSTAWMVYSQERLRNNQTNGPARLGSSMTEASAGFKNLSPEQLEHYNHIANQNKAANNKAYRQWIESHTPLVIRAANLARKALKRKGVKGYYQLQDERLVKGRRNPYSYFTSERFSSGDFKGMKVGEAARLAGREWKALSAAEKQPYEETSKQDLTRYIQERKTVYNMDVSTKPRAPPAAAPAA